MQLHGGKDGLCGVVADCMACYLMQVDKHTAGKGYSVFLAAVAPLKAPQGLVHIPVDGAADKVPSISVRATNRGWSSLILRHSTGPVASKVFMAPTVVNLTATAATTAVKEMVVNTKV